MTPLPRRGRLARIWLPARGAKKSAPGHRRIAGMMMSQLLILGAGVWVQTGMLATLPDRAAAQTPTPTPSPSPTLTPTAPTSAPTSAPTPVLYPRTEPLTIDLVNFTMPVRPDGTPIGFHIALPRQVDASARKIRFYCSRIYEVRQVTRVAYENCNGSGRLGLATLNAQACTEIGMYLDWATTFYDAGSLYFASFTREGDNDPSASTSGGFCSEIGAKVQIDVINMTTDAAIAQYGCYRDSCTSTRDCYVSVCDWGSCRRDVPAEEGISCTDGNSFTSADQCSADGQCAGMANYTFVLQVIPADPSISTLWGQPGRISSYVDHLSGQIRQIVELPELDITHFNLSVTDDVGFCTFGVINFREFFPYQLREILAPLVGEQIGLQTGSFPVVIQAITVSETPGGMLTTIATTVSTTTTTETSAAGSDGSLDGDDDDLIAGVVSLLIAAIIAGAVVLVAVVCCIRKCRGGKKQNNTSLPEENGMVNETQIDSATRNLLAGKVKGAPVATNPVLQSQVDVESPDPEKPTRTLTFHSGRTDTLKKPPAVPGSKPPLSVDNDSYVDPDLLESKVVAAMPPMQEDYLDLSDNKAAKNRKPKKSAPAPPPKAMKPAKALKSAPAPPPKAMKPPSGQGNYLDVDASKNPPKIAPPTPPQAAPPPLPSAPPPM